MSTTTKRKTRKERIEAVAQELETNPQTEAETNSTPADMPQTGIPTPEIPLAEVVEEVSTPTSTPMESGPELPPADPTPVDSAAGTMPAAGEQEIQTGQAPASPPVPLECKLKCPRCRGTGIYEYDYTPPVGDKSCRKVKCYRCANTSRDPAKGFQNANDLLKNRLNDRKRQRNLLGRRPPVYLVPGSVDTGLPRRFLP